MSYVIVIDSICEGWQAERDENGAPVIYSSIAEAHAEIIECEQDLFDNRHASDMTEGETRPESIDDCEAFAVPLSEYIEGRKTIFTG